MDTIIRASVLYWVLLFLLRIIGRRAASQLSPFELLVLFLLGGMTVQSIVADDRSVVNAITAAFAVAVNHLLASVLKQKSTRLRKVIDGTPVVVVEEGQVKGDRLSSLRMVEEDIMAAARQGGLKNFEQIRFAIVERDGSLTVFPREGAEASSKQG